MAGNKLVTDLVGDKVIFETMPNESLSGQTGVIRTVFLDRDGNPKYTVEVNGKLVDNYLLSARIVSE